MRYSGKLRLKIQVFGLTIGPKWGHFICRRSICNRLRVGG